VIRADDCLRHRVTALWSAAKPHRLVVHDGGAIRGADPGSRHHLRRRVVWLGSILVIPLVLLMGATASVRLNISPSLPYGLYRLRPVAPPLTRGMLVVVHVPGWSVRTRPFMKPIAAVSGEWVCRVGHSLVIHGADFGPVYDVWRGSPLPSVVAADTCAVVTPGYVFLATAAPYSLDSRYYGPVALHQIVATATPLLTWGPVHAATPLH
jgi:conjugative transfer signal peptidase TraF